MSEAELIRRLEKLERDNRRMKMFAAGVLVLAAGVSAIYATEPAPRKVIAHEFDLVDEAGRTMINLDGYGSQPSLRLFDMQGNPRMSLNVLKVGEGEPFVGIYDSLGHPRLTMSLDLETDTPGISLLSTNAKDQLGISLGDGNPHIWLHDARDFSLWLGAVNVQAGNTGERIQTSAASIVMFGNDPQHKAIWRAP